MSNLDRQAAMATARLKSAVAGVQPRNSTIMPSKRTVIPSAVAAAIVLVAGIVALISISGSSNHSTVSLVPSGLVAPPGPTNRYAPSGLGASIELPATWKQTENAGDFQYSMRGPGTAYDYLVASLRTGVTPITTSQMTQTRTQLLHSRGVSVESSSAGRIDGQPAVRLRYLLQTPAGNIADTEYDIFAGTTTLAVGASQHQTIYRQVIIVLGSPAAKPDTALLDWIASTIQITP